MHRPADIHFAQEITLAPRERRIVRFTPESTPVLNVPHPRLWWPYRMGEPSLHTLALEVEAEGGVSDRAQTRFGIREVTSELTDKGHRLFRVNGRPILIRGGGWASDMMLRRSSPRLRAEMRYVREMGLNAIRSEGKFESDEFFDLADEQGILVMIGWCCCDHWETWDKWDAEDRRVVRVSLTGNGRLQHLHLARAAQSLEHELGAALSPWSCEELRGALDRGSGSRDGHPARGART